MEWINVKDRLPNTGIKVLAFYRLKNGMSRTITAQYHAKFTTEDTSEHGYTEYCDEKDMYYTVEGWYETVDNWDLDYDACFVSEDITHWMPLPKPPNV